MRRPETDTAREKRFFSTLRLLPPDAQEFITGLSSQFLEPDIYRQFKSDPKQVKTLEAQLRQLELGPAQILDVLTYFNLSVPKSEQK